MTAAPTLGLRPLTLEDEAEARAAHTELSADDFDFLLDLHDGEPWAGYIERLERHRRGIDVPEGRVPATFLAAEAEGALVGRASVRHELNDWLAQWGGHIGYAIRPGFRRRGYATEILRQSLVLAASLGIDRALVLCNVTNVGSAQVIRRCGGDLYDIVLTEDGSGSMYRYWVKTP